MSRWAIVITEHHEYNKDNPWVDVCPVESYPKARGILEWYYSNFVRYYKERNSRRPFIPLDVKLEWKPEKPSHKMKLVIDVHDPQNKENLFISYEICHTIGVRTMDQRHRINVHLAETEP